MKVEYVSCQNVLIKQSMICLEGQEVLAKTPRLNLTSQKNETSSSLRVGEGPDDFQKKPISNHLPLSERLWFSFEEPPSAVLSPFKIQMIDLSMIQCLPVHLIYPSQSQLSIQD